jgi:ketosteroid isomerase-like protein
VTVEASTETLRAMLASWGEGDWSAGLDLLSDDVHLSAAHPGGQEQADGREGIEAFMRGFLAEWGNYRIELQDLDAIDDSRYLAAATQSGKGRASGMDVSSPIFIAIGMREGRIALLGFFLERDDAVAELESFH